MAHLQQVIICEDRRGSGKEHDPVRYVKQFWSTAGDLLGECDPLAPEYDRVSGEWVLKAWMKLMGPL